MEFNVKYYKKDNSVIERLLKTSNADNCFHNVRVLLSTHNAVKADIYQDKKLIATVYE